MNEDRFGGGRPRPTGPPGGPGGFDRPRFPRAPGPPAGTSLPPAQPHTVRLREGDREIEVSGSAAFVRQTIDDLPTILARLRGDTPPRPAAISMPSAPRERVPAVPDVPAAAPRPDARRATNGSAPAAPDDLEADILDVLRTEGPLAVVDIRRQLDGDVSGQMVRRILERSSAVSASADKPAKYRLRGRR